MASMTYVNLTKKIANKNERPNKGRRGIIGLCVVREFKCLLFEQIILMHRFQDFDTLYLYTDSHVYLYQQPSPEVTYEVATHRQYEWQYLNEISDTVVETCSKFILYPKNGRIYMLQKDADHYKTFEKIENVLNQPIVMFRFIDMKTFIELPFDSAMAPKSEIQWYDDIIPLGQSLDSRKSTVKKVSTNLPIVTIKIIENNLKIEICDDKAKIDISNEVSFEALPGFIGQESEDQAGNSRSEFVSSHTGSKKWVFPNTNTARFYLEPQTVKGSLFSIVTKRSHQPARYAEYIDERVRFHTFITWASTSISAERLCKAGFFYTKQGDLVRCFQCGIGFKDFNRGDDPVVEHVRYAGKCPFLYELLGEQHLNRIKEYLQASDPEYFRTSQLSANKNTSTVSSAIKYPQYQPLEARISSYYNNWPRDKPQTPNKMAEAGLFYSGPEDCVTCYACGGSLKNWEPNDDPMKEHSFWFPSCSFIRLTNGDDSTESTSSSESLSTSPRRDTEISENSREEQTSFSPPVSEPITNGILHTGSDSSRDRNKFECLQMGYTIEDYAGAIKELRSRGTHEPTISEIVDVIVSTRESRSEDEILVQNRRLRSMVYCMNCKTAEANILFLPCTHHIYCVSCSNNVTACPLCQKHITEKMRTFMS